MQKVQVRYKIRYPHVVYGNPFSPVAVLLIYPYSYPDRGHDITEEDVKAYREYMRLCHKFVEYGASVAGLQNTEFGICLVAKTLEQNPNIRYLIVVGKSKGHRVDLVYKLLKQKLYREPLSRYISRQTFERLIEQVEIIDLIGCEPREVASKVIELIQACYQERPTRVVLPSGEIVTVWDRGAYKRGAPKIVLRKCSRLELPSVYILVVDTIREAWEETVRLIEQEGVEIRDWRGRRLYLPKPLLLTIEKPLEPDYGIDEQSLKMYLNSFFSPETRREYTYGARLVYHFDIDQLEAVIKHLREGRHTHAHVVTYDPRIDTLNPDKPCLTEFHFIKRGEYLSLRVSIRSWDCGRALPFNLYACAKILEYVGQETNLKPKTLIILSDEPHLYLT